MNDWAVYRIDYNSNEFLVEKGLSKDEADRIAADYIARGHHQHYWVDKQPAEEFNAQSSLNSMLKSGSSRELAVSVLLSQGVSIDNCVEALAVCTTMSPADCRAIVQAAAMRKSKTD